MRVLLIRHGESSKNTTERFGDSRVAFQLTAVGVRQSHQLAELISPQLSEVNPTQMLIVSSSEPRAYGSALILQERLRAELLIDDRLNPIDSGLLSGVTEDEARVMSPDVMHKKDLYRQGLLSGFELAYPNGESVHDFQQRVLAALFVILKRHSESGILLVGHQSTITAILSYYTNLAEHRSFYHFFHLDPCGVSELDVQPDGSGEIHSINRILAEEAP